MHNEATLVPATTIGAMPVGRTWPWRHLAIASMALAAATSTAAAVAWSDSRSSPEDRSPPARDVDAITRQLVERGLVPRETLSGG